jgi:hypothetical protein
MLERVSTGGKDKFGVPAPSLEQLQNKIGFFEGLLSRFAKTIDSVIRNAGTVRQQEETARFKEAARDVLANVDASIPRLPLASAPRPSDKDRSRLPTVEEIRTSTALAAHEAQVAAIQNQIDEIAIADAQSIVEQQRNLEAVNAAANSFVAGVNAVTERAQIVENARASARARFSEIANLQLALSNCTEEFKTNIAARKTELLQHADRISDCEARSSSVKSALDGQLQATRDFNGRRARLADKNAAVLEQQADQLIAEQSDHMEVVDLVRATVQNTRETTHQLNVAAGFNYIANVEQKQRDEKLEAEGAVLGQFSAAPTPAPRPSAPAQHPNSNTGAPSGNNAPRPSHANNNNSAPRPQHQQGAPNNITRYSDQAFFSPNRSSQQRAEQNGRLSTVPVQPPRPNDDRPRPSFVNQLQSSSAPSLKPSSACTTSCSRDSKLDVDNSSNNNSRAPFDHLPTNATHRSNRVAPEGTPTRLTGAPPSSAKSSSRAQSSPLSRREEIARRSAQWRQTLHERNSEGDTSGRSARTSLANVAVRE